MLNIYLIVLLYNIERLQKKSLKYYFSRHLSLVMPLDVYPVRYHQYFCVEDSYLPFGRPRWENNKQLLLRHGIASV